MIQQKMRQKLYLLLCLLLTTKVAAAQSSISSSLYTPTLSVCGSGPHFDIYASMNTDITGIIHVGHGIVSSCQMMFATAWSSPPFCTISDEEGTFIHEIGGHWVNTYHPPTTNTMMYITGLPISDIAGLHIKYVCWGRE